MTKRKMKPMVITLSAIGAAAVLTVSAYLVTAFSFESTASPKDVIKKYVENSAEYQNLAVKDFLNPEFIDNTELIEIEEADAKFAAIHSANYSGKYTDVVAYNVKYEVNYKEEYEYMMTESSGIKEKLFILIDTEDGWLIDGIGY